MISFATRPRRVLRPVQWLPPQIPESLIAVACNHLLREAVAEGQLDQLRDRALRIVLDEPRLDLRFALRQGRIRPAPASWTPAATIRAHAEDLIVVLDQRVDPDTLFFRRRLHISGDTALGLTVKNLLDSLDPARLPSPLRSLLHEIAGSIPADY